VDGWKRKRCALGEEVGNLVPDSVFDLCQPSALLPEPDGVVFERHLPAGPGRPGASPTNFA
jgi:hypothetical protein